MKKMLIAMLELYANEATNEFMPDIYTTINSKKYKGNISLASEALGLTRASLYRRMEKFGL